MAAGRLSPAELRARLQSGLAGEALRGAASTAGPMQGRAHAVESPAVDAPAVDAPAVDAPAVDAPVPTIGVGRPRPRAMPDPAVRAVWPHARPQPTGSLVQVLHRHDSAAVLRGYRIPVTLHRRAERAKLAASAQRREPVAWDEILQIAIDALPAASVIANGLEAQRARSGSEALPHAGPTRVLQGAIRRDQEMLLRTMRLDLEELLDRRVQLEELWTWMVARFCE